MDRTRRSVLTVVLAALAATAVACSSSSGGSREASGGTGVVIPNAPAGDSQARGLRDPATARATPELTPGQARTLAASRQCQAERIWNAALRIECSNPEDAADLFEDIAEDYPEFERAAEALFRQGRALFRAKDYDDSVDAFVEYMKLAPVNPHLAEVEQMIFESGVRYLASGRGPLNIFGTDSVGLSALKYVAQTFPTGEYADDALMRLGCYFYQDEDYTPAALTYRELLLRYPDSEWSFQARLRLADTYYARDQGDPYHGGFVVLDPREPIPEAAAILGGPVASALMLAMREYETYIERMEADPARLTEYCRDVEYARRRLQSCRERLASKDLFRANWYEDRGDRCASLTYWRSAALWSGTRAGTTAYRRLEALNALGKPAAAGSGAPTSGCGPPPRSPAGTVRTP